MTPAEFHEHVLPELLSRWERQCFCSAPGFRKLISFNFREYGDLSPLALADAEIVIQALICERFIRIENSSPQENEQTSERVQEFECPQCQARCTATFEQFNIHMERSFVTFADLRPAADEGLYLVGFFGFRADEHEKIHDFRHTMSVQEFIQAVAGGT